MADAHTRLFHELLEPMLRLDLTGVQFRIILWVARNSYGRNGARFARYSWRRMAMDFRMDRRGVARLGADLLKRGILRTNEAGEIGIDKHRVRSLALGPQSQGDGSPMGLGCTKEGTTVPGAFLIVKEKRKSADAQPTQPQGKDPNVKAIIDYFFQRCREVRGFKPAISGGKDGAAVKSILAAGETPDTLRALVDFYLKSKKADDCGVTLAAALSAHSVNLFRQQHALRPADDADARTRSYLQQTEAAA
ncbi:MAG: replication protein [Elusimicrobia bacterium]|nr:replication protein [Elusimicrobiota bacterium]